MIREKCVICVSSIDWDFVWQGHQEIMSAFAKAGNKVLFIENTGIRPPNLTDIKRLKQRIINWRKGPKGIRQESENLFVCSPIILPFPYSRIAGFINRFFLINSIKLWMKAANFQRPIIWTFLPTYLSLDIISEIDNALVVYYCIAEFAELASSSKKVAKTESTLLKRCDVVFAQGKKIKERCQRWNSNVHIFPFGVKTELFSRPQGEAPIPKDTEGLPRPIFGYVGGIHKHVDFVLLKKLARRFPNASIALVGPVQTGGSREIEGLKNVFFLGKKPHEELPSYIDSFDACLIPYEVSEYTKTVYPTKLNEYLMRGKSVISSALPEVQEFNESQGGLVHVAENHEDFLKKAEIALKGTGPTEIGRRKDAALSNSWERRIEEMSVCMEKALSEKEATLERGWKENFLKVYKASRGRMFKTALLAAAAYLLIFYSPLLWVIARPLKISQNPVKADAIVVFGGGVGEGGSPGKSTYERAGYSVELYKGGYAKKIIYSSGYTFKYNDAENMRSFAMSMGVPERDIILEKDANSCYENVIYTDQILKRHGFNKVLLVTSPYNTRRSSFVFRKRAKGIGVVYVPVPNPRFYHRELPIKLEQINAILHEYMGILYYLTKGYI